VTMVRAKLMRKGSGNPTLALMAQFNPTSLRISYTNQFGNDPPESHVRKTSAKLDVELIFDTTDTGHSVYQYLNQLEAITRSIQPVSPGSTTAEPSGSLPIVQFHWSENLFEGLVESLTQTLDYWSYDGIPLRATVQLGIKETGDVNVRDSARAHRRAAEVRVNDQANNIVAIPAPLSARGTTDTAMRGGNSLAGRGLAALNGMETMRGGATSAMASAGVFAGADAGAMIGASAGIKLEAAASFKMSGGVSAGAKIAGGASLGFGLGASAGASASAGLGASVGVGMSAGAGIGAGVSAGARAGASATAGVSATAGAFAGLGTSKMPIGNMGFNPSALLPPVLPSPIGPSAQFDSTGRLSNSGGAVVAESYSVSRRVQII
jgi:Contractile injection system tube protein